MGKSCVSAVVNAWPWCHSPMIDGDVLQIPDPVPFDIEATLPLFVVRAPKGCRLAPWRACCGPPFDILDLNSPPRFCCAGCEPLFLKRGQWQRQHTRTGKGGADSE
jgi:hypothetical protein